MKTMLAVAALALSLSPALGQQAQHTMVNANDVQWKDAPPVLPGAQLSVLYGDPTKEGMFVMRLKLPANYRVPPTRTPSMKSIRSSPVSSISVRVKNSTKLN
jgi:hypothetical protein